MTTKRTWMKVMVPVVAAGVIAGCVKREEKITVARDGRVTIELDIEGKPGEMECGDAWPSAASGWNMTYETRHDEHDGDLKAMHSLRTFEAGETLPRSFAAPNDPDAAMYLDFPTEVKIEDREDGTYYHFHRVYSPRPFQRIHYAERAYIDDEVKKLAETPVEQLPDEQKLKILRAFAKVESAKLVDLARIALSESGLNVAQDHWLLARKAALDVYDAIDWDAILTIYQESSTEARDARFARESDRVRDEAAAAMLSTLRKTAKLSDESTARFERKLTAEQRRFDLTNAISGHSFGVAVELPGELIAHNGKDVTNGAATWEFSGEDFRDRAFELMASSRVAKGSGGGR